METFKEYLTPEIIWFFIGLVLLLLEFAMPGLIIVFFGIGAWVTALGYLIFGYGLNMQILVFLISSVLSLIILRKYLKRKFFSTDTNQQDTLIDEFLGQTAIALTHFKAGQEGKVEFKGTQWNAVSDHEIKKGQSVKIISKESIKLRIEPNY